MFTKNFTKYFLALITVFFSPSMGLGDVNGKHLGCECIKQCDTDLENIIHYRYRIISFLNDRVYFTKFYEYEGDVDIAPNFWNGDYTETLEQILWRGGKVDRTTLVLNSYEREYECKVMTSEDEFNNVIANYIKKLELLVNQQIKKNKL